MDRSRHYKNYNQVDENTQEACSSCSLTKSLRNPQSACRYHYQKTSYEISKESNNYLLNKLAFAKKIMSHNIFNR